MLVGATSLAARRTGVLPVWLAWIGLIASPLMVVSLPAFGLALIAVVVWVLVVSAVLLFRTGRSASSGRDVPRP